MKLTLTFHPALFTCTRNLQALHTLNFFVGSPGRLHFSAVWCQPSVLQGFWHPLRLMGCCNRSLPTLRQILLMKWAHWSTFAWVSFSFYVVRVRDCVCSASLDVNSLSKWLNVLSWTDTIDVLKTLYFLYTLLYVHPPADAQQPVAPLRYLPLSAF